MNDEDLRVMIWAMLRMLDGKQLRMVYRFVRGLRAADEGTTSSVSASSADTFPGGEGSV